MNEFNKIGSFLNFVEVFKCLAQISFKRLPLTIIDYNYTFQYRGLQQNVNCRGLVDF